MANNVSILLGEKTIGGHNDLSVKDQWYHEFITRGKKLGSDLLYLLSFIILNNIRKIEILVLINFESKRNAINPVYVAKLDF